MRNYANRIRIIYGEPDPKSWDQAGRWVTGLLIFLGVGIVAGFTPLPSTSWALSTDKD